MYNFSKKINVVVLLLVGILIFFFNLGSRDLWDPDETRYAVIAREMRESRNWVLPHLNGKIYGEKPPLYFWLINFSIFLLGKNSEFANRLPSALSGFTTVLVTFFFGERLFNYRVGFTSALILATCILFPSISRWVILDSLLTLFFVLTLFSFYRGLENKEKRKLYYLLAGLFMGFGVLTKGPVAYLTIPIFIIFTILTKRVIDFLCTELLWSFLLSVLVVSVWFVPACLEGGKYYANWILFKQVIGTYIEGGKHFHAKRAFFYFIRFPLEFIPWIVFLPNSIISGLKRYNEKKKEFFFLFVWFVFIFLFFTFSKGKKDNYILPLYPAASIMIGTFFDFGFRFLKSKKIIITGLISLIIIFLIGFFSILIFSPKKIYISFIEYQHLLGFILFYLMIGSLISLILFLKNKRWASFTSIILIFIAFHLHISSALLPGLNSQRSMKNFSERILKRMASEDDIKTYWFTSNGLLYYTKKSYIEEINNTDRFKEVFNSSKRIFIVIFEEMFDQLKRETGIDMIPIEKAQIGHWKYVLVSNH
ncbi:MAG: ArnT family glycosyltransferase [Candidatus Jordarchaeum sp.]|uniref:ArnT family glycosyltransferase n=1 Tax=Candidatus Jordarchaeum sp. TaxID=2823881 RepID=UPI0040494B6D